VLRHESCFYISGQKLSEMLVFSEILDLGFGGCIFSIRDFLLLVRSNSSIKFHEFP